MVKPVSDEPYVDLAHWHFAHQGDEFRLVGIPAGSRRGRITSSIASYDADERRAVTASGRVYRLIGEPDPDIGRGSIVAYYRKWDGWAPPLSLADESEVAAGIGPKLGFH